MSAIVVIPDRDGRTVYGARYLRDGIEVVSPAASIAAAKTILEAVGQPSDEVLDPYALLAKPAE